MSVGSWTPDSGSQATAALLSEPFLKRCIALGSANSTDELKDHEDVLGRDEQLQYEAVMTLSEARWQEAVAGCSNDELRALVRFFTLAEMLFSGWEADDQSPVIWLARQLKQADEPLQRDEVMWIRQNSRNRFLPNGPVL